ncbi:MAG TPA: replication protein P [Marinagarivorans sp.]
MKHSLPTEAGPIDQKPRREQQIDAINQVFALFRLNYHAQFFKAFATEAELTQIKKLWLSELSRFAPGVMLRAAKSILESSDFLPTLHTMIRHCEAHSDSASLPDAHSAYLEACRAPSPKSRYRWSHPAVYHAGKACDWYFLQTSAEHTAYPIFKKKYQDVCDRVRAGEELKLEPEAAVEHKPKAQPNKEEGLKKLEALRAALDL